MNPISIRAAARALTVATLALALPAQAATQSAECLSEAEVKAMMTFAMPSALGGLIAHCTPHLAANGFMRTSGAQLVASYGVGKQAAWPRARSAFLKFAGDKDPANTDLVAQMPDSALQPFVEGLIGGMIGAKLKPAQCTLADKMMRLLAPLPPENLVELVGTIVTLAGNEPKKGAPAGTTMCKA